MRHLWVWLTLPCAACLFPSLSDLDGTSDGGNVDSPVDGFVAPDSGADVLDASTSDAFEASTPPITIVQAVGLAVFGQPQNVVVTMPSPQTKGNLTVVAVSWQSTGSVTSITDKDNNTYKVAVPSTSSIDLGHAIYYASNIHGGLVPNVITVTAVLSSSDAGADDPNVGIVEISGLDTTAPFMTMNQANANSAAMNSGNVVTTTPRAILFASGVLDYGASFPDGGTSFTPIPLVGMRSGDIVGYQIVQTTGTYAATVTLPNPTYWMLQLAVFK